MSKKRYVFNPDTLQYEKVSFKSKEGFKRLIGYSTVTLFCATLIAFVFYNYIPSPKEKALEHQLVQLEYNYSSITGQLDLLSKDLSKIHEKDREVHRMIFGLDPIDDSVWEGGTGGTDKYQFVDQIGNSSEIMEQASKKVDKLKYKLALQNKSLDTIFTLALERQNMLNSIPSIKPVQEDKLKRKIRHLSGYGWRIHPVHKVKKLHKGIDFTAPRGTAIQSTGDGVVIRVEKRKSGYGNNVTIDHGYGFTSLYAHMDKIIVKKGEKVNKGQKIGTVGSTGTSTAPHLHYEVRKNGKHVDPIDFVMDGLSPEEYQELVEKAGVENQTFH